MEENERAAFLVDLSRGTAVLVGRQVRARRVRFAEHTLLLGGRQRAVLDHSTRRLLAGASLLFILSAVLSGHDGQD